MMSMHFTEINDKIKNFNVANKKVVIDFTSLKFSMFILASKSVLRSHLYIIPQFNASTTHYVV